MSYRWSGLYLRTDKKKLLSLLPIILESKGYSILETYHKYDERVAKELTDSRWFWDGERFDPIFILDANDDWVRIIGLEQVDVCQPRLVFNSEIIHDLECDAFECGYYEDDPDTWWYVYYKNGVAEDQFRSHLEEFFDIVQILNDGPLDPLDPIGIYINHIRESKNEIDDYLIPLPSDVLRKYRGDPSKYLELIKVNDPSIVKQILGTKDPLLAISQLSEALVFPYIGDFSALDLYDELRCLADDKYREIGRPSIYAEKLVEKGISLLISVHPLPIPLQQHPFRELVRNHYKHLYSWAPA